NPLLHLASKYEQDLTDSRWLITDRRVYSASGQLLGLQSFSKTLGGTIRKEHAEFVDFPIATGTGSLLDSTQEGYPYGIVRAQEYLDFLNESTKWNSSLKTISQQQQ
ncbi:MAG TPA: hypothetical protein VFD12_09895, partial [Oligella sp.]|nr:hypothetical protein [Oligella sp.]